ncbi:MAG: hypothetical protein Kow0068_04160 [Marinilabiliales bacterium]
MGISKYIALLLILYATSIYVFSQNLPHKARMDSMWNKLTDTTFLSLLEQNNLKLEYDDSFYVVPVKKNYDIFYQYALACCKDSFEVRFLFNKIDVQQYQDNNINLDDFCYSLMNITAMNASGANFANLPLIEITAKNNKSNDLNIVWEAKSKFNPKTDFGKDYVFCYLYSRRLKDGIILFYFLLFTDYDKQKHLEKKSLQFIKNK